MFVDRSAVLSLVDQMISVEGGNQVRADDRRPVLVIEGSGASGRSTFLEAIRDAWAGKTPTAWVEPRLMHTSAAQGVRPVLLDVLLGLSGKVEGYHVQFPRVITAFIAMRKPVLDEDPERAAQVMRDRVIEYGARIKQLALIGELVTAIGKVVQATSRDRQVGDTVVVVSNEIGSRIPGILRRTPLAISGPFAKAVKWFAHQDRGLTWEPLGALVHLSRQAVVDTEAVRRDVDDLLITALLADLRESLSGVANRPSNALIVIDDGDMPTARAFIKGLVRVQGRVGNPLVGQPHRPPDPLAVVISSGGLLAEDLVSGNTQPVSSGKARDDEAIVPDIRRHATWMPVQLSDFTGDDVRAMTEKHMWRPTLGSSTISDLIYRLTGGHAGATVRVLEALKADQAQLGSLDKVLGDRSFTAPDTLEKHLLDKFVGGLRPSGTVDKSLREDLIVLAAARDVAEAESLAGLLRAPSQEVLLTSRTLWSGRRVTLPPVATPPSTSPVLSPLVRYLGLRELARRTGDHEATWDDVFGTLRDQAAARGEAAREGQAGVLHHELALGHHALVIDEFAALLPVMADDKWLALLDAATATPNPRWCFVAPRNAPARPTGHGELIARLVVGQLAASDPALSDPEELHDLYSRLSNDFRHLAGNSRVFLKRAEYYSGLAAELS